MDFIEKALTRPRCSVCDWPLAESVEAGCVEGNCSYRPQEGTAEHSRIKQRLALEQNRLAIEENRRVREMLSK